MTGLEQFGLENKKVAKEFGRKFACGSSVVKAAAGGEEIVVQGDLSDDILDFIVDKYKDVPEDNIEQVLLLFHNSTIPPSRILHPPQRFFIITQLAFT